MDLDEQLAALAAGELDGDTARALRARAAADPAIAGRLARHVQLQQLLEDWEAPTMSDAAVARLEARVDEALAALGDEPLADERAEGLPPQPRARSGDRDGSTGGAPAAGGRVVDLGEARQRRGLPSWVGGIAVAAALAAVVGTGIVVGGLPGGGQQDTVAEPAQDATDGAVREEAEDDAAAATEAELFDSGQDTTADSGSAAPLRQSGIDLDEGDLLALVELAPAVTAESSAGTGQNTAGDDAGDEAAAVTVPARCVTEALERDTVPADGRDVWLVAEGTYDGQDAAFVVVRTPATPDDHYEVLAYDPADCALLARDATNP